MNRNVYIDGISILSKYGSTLAQFWNSLNISIKSECNIIDDELWHQQYEEYFIGICVDAVLKASANAGIKVNDAESIVIGTGMGMADVFLKEEKASDFMSSLKEKIKDILKYNGPVLVLANACSASAQAIAYAYDLIKYDQLNHVIAGGIEIYSKMTEAGFQRLNSIDESGCRPFDRNRKGIYIGEGAAFFSLTKKTNPHHYCKILGYGMTNDACHVVSPDSKGCYAKKAIMAALENSKLKPKDVDAVIAHGTGTKLNDQVESQVLDEVFGCIDITTNKGTIGHTGGASGAFSVAEAIAMLKYQAVPSINNLREVDEKIKGNPIHGRAKKKCIKRILINNSAFGGTNIAIICEKNGTDSDREG